MQKLRNLHFSRRREYGNDYDPIIESEFGHIFEKVRDFTMTSKERAYTLYKAVQYVVRFNIAGDLVECGTWKGGSAMVMAYALLEMNSIDRRIFLYDTFEGMPRPTFEDYRIEDRNVYAEDEWKKQQNGNKNKWCFSPLSQVKKNMSLTKYPEEQIVFVKGKVEDTVPKIIPEKISLLRLDTDWYESTKHELWHFYPIVVKNGILIVDDYGFWAGAKKATDEYFSGNNRIFLCRIDNTGRIGIKPQM